MSSARRRGSSGRQTGARDGRAPARASFGALTVRQRFLLVLVVVLLPVLALLTLEAGLRAFGYGDSYPLFVPVEQRSEYLVPNAGVANRYFRHEAALPAPLADLFRAEKAPNTYRIFVQGASSAAGFPYFHGGAFSRMLEQRLQQTFPDHEIEVVNTALDATNSHTLLDLAPEIIEQAPDAVLLYAGHNEYYGVLGVASAESVGRWRVVVRSYIALRKLRTVQLFQAGLDRAAAFLWSILDREPPPTRTLMEYLASQHTVRYGSPVYRAGLSQLDANLRDLLRRYRDAGIPVFIGTLASNERDRPPFIGGPVESVDSAAWQQGLNEARRAIESNDTTAATAALNALLATDATAAEPFFLRGRLLERNDDFEGARAAYRAARDRDQLPFRAPSEANRIIRQTADQEGAILVETLEALAQASPRGILGNTLMLEHLHPNIEGQLRLADAFYRALEQAGAIGSWQRRVPLDTARARAPVTVVDSLAGEYMIARLTSRFPFQPAGTTGRSGQIDVPPSPRGPIERLAYEYHEGRLPWVQALGRLQEHYAAMGEWEQAAHVNRVVAQEMAYAPEPLIMAAQASIRAGDHARALEDLLAAERRLPTAEGKRLQGDIAAREGDLGAARWQYQQAVALDRRDRRASAALQAAQAIPRLEQAAEERPGDLDGRVDLATAYLLTGRPDRARDMAERVLQEDPEHARAAQFVRQLDASYRTENE